MKNIVLTILLLLFTLAFITGCAEQSSPEKKEIETKEPLSISNNLLDDDKENFNTLKRNILHAHQIVAEFDLMLSEMQKVDELDSAIETMNIAREESIAVLTDIQSLPDIQDSNIRTFQNEVEESLKNFINGLTEHMQGMDIGDATLMQSGFTKMEQAKGEMEVHYKKILNLPLQSST